MYIYNTTFVCDDSRLEEFLIWLDAEFIPALVATGVAKDAQLAHVLPMSESDEKEAASFSVQVKVEDADALQEWMKQTFYPSIDGLASRFGDKVLYFATILEVLPINRYN